MENSFTALVFDVDIASLASLREALPEWRVIDRGALTANATDPVRNQGDADLVVVGVHRDVEETLGLCRHFAFGRSFSGAAEQTAPGNTGSQSVPLLVLVPPGQESLIAAALKAGAHSCLMLPIHAKEVASMLLRVRAGNQPGRHTLNLETAQRADRWRDTGGEG